MSKRKSSNIWTGSDSDFVASPDIRGEGSCVSVSRAPKRLKLGKQTKLDYGGGDGKKKKPTNVKPVVAPGFVVVPDPAQSSPVSDLGVPLSLRHARRAGLTDGVWDLIHHLDVPYQKRNPWQKSRKLYRNLCLLCCEDVKSRTKTTRYSWEDALCSTKNASNAKTHIKLMHADHPLAVLAEQKITDKAKDDIVGGEADACSILEPTTADRPDELDNEDKTTIPATTAPAGLKDEAVCLTPKPAKRFFRPNEKMINVLISKWMINQGLPYTVCTSDAFKDVICAATGDLTFPILSRDRHARLLAGQFQLFCDLVGEFSLLSFRRLVV
ncbi:hypothetical protein AM588_10000360 [Phytophthora nicotianae]|uniref:Uncharacterized protein n=1 Tax=Phytophthora nicotianae TaxID=4792 RepID=A0A0W8CDU8_PHYNI|nr:hypothetical protein AM588_10000360 [Phytophthora nicotianae]